MNKIACPGKVLQHRFFYICGMNKLFSNNLWFHVIAGSKSELV